jgi:hypothetical protein
MPESIELLSLHALNRATLARQLLLQRARLTPLQAIRRLVAAPDYAGLRPLLQPVMARTALHAEGLGVQGFAAPGLRAEVQVMPVQ